MERPRKRGRPPGSKNKPKDSKQSKFYKHNRGLPTITMPSKQKKATAPVDSDEDIRVVVTPRKPGHRRSSNTTTPQRPKKRKQTSDDDGDVSDESQVQRRPVKRARQANKSSDEEEHDSDDDPFAEEQGDADRDVEDIDDEDSNPGSDTDLGDDPSSTGDTSSYQSQDSNNLSADLTEEEKRVLIPPKKAIIEPEGNWVYEDELPQNLTNRARVDDDYKDAVAFNHDWTEEDERQLWNTWTKSDALVLDKVGTGERAVWRKVKHLFGIPAPEVILPFLQVNPQHLRPVKVQVKSRRHPSGETVHLEHVNWGQGFCTLLVKILCTPAFSMDLAFLRYVLQYAVYFRVGEDEEKCPKPRKEDFFCDDYFTLINEVADEYSAKRVPEEYSLLVNDAISAKLLHKHHPHMKFIEDLKKAVKKKKKEGYLGIINLDLQHIINAWNLRYIKRKENYGTLTMEEYQRAYEKSGNSDKGRLPKGGIQRNIQIANERRNWIMSCRRKQAIWEKQNNLPGSPLLASEIDEEGGIEEAFEWEVGEELTDKEKDVVEAGHTPVSPPHLQISSSPEVRDTPPLNQSFSSRETILGSNPELSPQLIPQLVARSSSSSPRGGLIKGHWNLWTSGFILDELEDRLP
jgi:hypothetical protein